MSVKGLRKTPVLLILALILATVLYMISWALDLNAQPAYCNSVAQMAIIVPGGGLLDDGELPPHTVLRLQQALDIYHACERRACKVIALSAGTTHKPQPRDARGFPVTEAAAAAKYLLSQGVVETDMLEESLSLDTIGNAYFLRTLHTDVLGIRRLVIVTNDWHMARTAAIFRSIFDLQPLHSPICGGPSEYVIDTVAVDDGLPKAHLVARRQREAASLAAFREHTRHLWFDLPTLHARLFGVHSAYASSRLTAPPAPALDAATLATY
jgi:uncharacterized SAM-binding protein YcdF (DUF218 family)